MSDERQKSDTISKVGRKPMYKPEYCAMLIEHMREGLAFRTFGAIAGVTRKTLYEWVDRYPEFAEAKDLAFLHSQLCYERILAGKARGDIKYKLADMSATVFALKTRFKDDYSEKAEMEITVSKIQIDSAEENL